MRFSQRQVVLALLALFTSGALITLLSFLFTPVSSRAITGTASGLVLLIVLLFAYWRGWDHARYVTLVLVTLLIGLTTDGVYLTETFSVTTFLPPVLALIIAGPLSIAGSALTLLAILIVRAGGQGVYVNLIALVLYGMSVGGLILARIVTDMAQLRAEESAEQARQTLARSEAQAQDLAQKAAELEAQNRQQQQLLDLVSTLETPAVALADGVLLAPVVGHLDTRRIANLTRRLLDEVSAQRSRMVILDIAGVPGVDTAVVQALLRTVQALRLLGCEVTITGISAAVAATMTQLGITMAGVRTARTPQEVIRTGIDLAANLRQN